MPSERKLNVSLSMKIKGESTSVNVLPMGPICNIYCGRADSFFCSYRVLCLRHDDFISLFVVFVPSHDTKFIIYFIYETFNDNSAFFKFESKTLFSI